MEHIEHVNLIKKAITAKGGNWADLGSGDGAFTLALRDLAGPDVEIYSVDKDKVRLKNQRKSFDKMFPNTKIHFIEIDFTHPLELPFLDGILMANSLHYVDDQEDFLNTIQKRLKHGGKLVLVEYSIDDGNKWVPFPLSFESFSKLARKLDFKKVELLERIPSTYWEEMYSAQAIKK